MSTKEKNTQQKDLKRQLKKNGHYLSSEVGNYLLETSSWHDCYFLVGEKKERIGAVKCNLINQSKVWFVMLSPESSLVEESEISIPDIEPDVFKLLLKHCYAGLEDCSTLPVETLIKLCYCANKYHMRSLLNKIAKALKPSNVDQLFPALQCLVHFNLHHVEKAVQHIISTETSDILDHEEFLECDPTCVTYIAQQETLCCSELDLWKAVVKWAKHRAGSNEQSKLRWWILGPLKHIRLLVFSTDQLCDNVFIHNILDSSEISRLCSRNILPDDTLCKLSVSRMSPDFCFDDSDWSNDDDSVDSFHSLKKRSRH